MKLSINISYFKDTFNYNERVIQKKESISVFWQSNLDILLPLKIPSGRLALFETHPHSHLIHLFSHLMQNIILINRLHLLRTRTPLVKPIRQPLPNQPPRQLQPNNPLSQTQHLRVITQHRSLNTKTIMRRHCPDSSYFVRCDGDAESGSAD